jgi:hypothetical protein
MKAYQWLAVSAAIAVTALRGWLFRTAGTVVSRVETQAADAHDALGAERTDPADATALGAAVSGERLRAHGATLAVALLALLGNPARAAAQEAAVCAARLTVEVSPSVPRAADDGFISSLLNNHVSYHLDLLRQEDSSVLEVELTGPGPDYRCQKVIEAMRKDARVQSIHVEST